MKNKSEHGGRKIPMQTSGLLAVLPISPSLTAITGPQRWTKLSHGWRGVGFRRRTRYGLANGRTRTVSLFADCNSITPVRWQGAQSSILRVDQATYRATAITSWRQEAFTLTAAKNTLCYVISPLRPYQK